MDHSDIGARFKRYELVTEGHLYRRTPVIIRLDGNAFHAFTRKHWGRTWSADFNACMVHAVLQVMPRISGTKLAFIQSDEVSLFLTDYDTLATEPWFGYDLSKVVSISSGMLAAFFSKSMESYLGKSLDHPVWFDSRAFNVPREEVTNYFIWRQRDAVRNSISFFASQFFSHKELQAKSCRQMMLMCEARGYKWEDLPAWRKNGLVIRRGFDVGEDRWVTDKDTPKFTVDFDFIERYVNCEKDEIKDKYGPVTSGTAMETQYDEISTAPKFNGVKVSMQCQMSDMCAGHQCDHVDKHPYLNACEDNYCIQVGSNVKRLSFIDTAKVERQVQCPATTCKDELCPHKNLHPMSDGCTFTCKGSTGPCSIPD